MTPLRALAAPAGEAVLADALRRWLPGQRWYAGRARDVVDLHVQDSALISAPGDPLLVVLVDVTYGDGGSERYHVPLAALPDHGEAAKVVARFPDGVLVDAAASPAACRLLAHVAQGRGRHSSASGAVVAGQAAATEHAAADMPHGAVRPLGAEQSNSSVVIDGRMVLKLYRRVQPGVHPDVELPEALAHAGLSVAPAPLGAVLLQQRHGHTLLASLAEYLPHARDGWQVALNDLAAQPPGGPASGDVWHHAFGLGETVALMHRALRDELGDWACDPATQQAWIGGMRVQAQQVLALAQRHAPDAAAPVVRRAAEVDAIFGRLAGLGDLGPLTRVHGDLHLGQTLLSQDGWRILDFEGEPQKPLAQRRQPHSPLKDVAGMLRSFEYAAAHAPGGAGAPQWREQVRRRFWTGYLSVAQPAGLLPPRPTVTAALRQILELDKAIYELGYELAHRPQWVAVPVNGIVSLLDGLARGGES